MQTTLLIKILCHGFNVDEHAPHLIAIEKRIDVDDETVTIREIIDQNIEYDLPYGYFVLDGGMLFPVDMGLTIHDLDMGETHQTKHVLCYVAKSIGDLGFKEV